MLRTRVVGERSDSSEVLPQGQDGVVRCENAGMSSESGVRILTTESLRFPQQRSSTEG